jgi:hypothetical protein
LITPHIEIKERFLKSSSCTKETNHWVRTEFDSAEFGDYRLNKRLISIMESFSAYPNASIPQATGSWKKTKGAYRFLSNPKVSHQNILRPHQEATRERINGKKIVLAIQDTSTLNYSHLPQTEGLGYVGHNTTIKGMLVHTTLAITPEKTPLGIIDQQTWIRPIEKFGKRREHKQKTISEKESIKWLNSLTATENVQKTCPDTLMINIGDREADIYELFHQAQGCITRLLVRAAWNRKLDHSEKLLWLYMKTQPLAAKLEITVPRKHKKPQRTAIVSLRFAPVSLKPPKLKRNLKPVKLWAIYLYEPSPPKGEEPLSWMLLTTLKTDSLDDAIQRVEYYSMRFTIETFHKILKSGCNIEKRQLETAERLRRCLAIDSIVAWRIMFLTMVGRTVPNLPCTVILKDHEWKSLYCFVHETKQLPPKPPSLEEAVRLIARLGGFLNRKSDGYPGVKVLWRGMQVLSIISLAWESFGPETVKHPRDS